MFVVIGTANIDLIVSGFDRMPVVMGDEFTTSSLVFCEEALTMVLGGNGANAAYALAGLGAPTALCSAVGQDALGGIVGSWLEEQGVRLTGLARHPARATAFTTIVSDRTLNRLAFHHQGALATYTLADIPPALLTTAEVILATSYTIMPGLRPHGFAHLLTEAQKRGTITALDIGPAIGTPAAVAELAPLLPAVNYLLTNRHELAVCTGTDQVADGAAHLRAAGARTVIVKAGQEGAAIFDAAGERRIPAFAVAVQTTVGAGDSFNAGLLYALHQGQSVTEAVRYGNAVAALTISSGKGILGCPTRSQVAALLARP
jgi:ribokinase